MSATAGVLVHTRRDRELAAAQWLLLSAFDTRQARHDWATYGVALLRCGVLFSAVRMPAAVVHAAAGTDDREELAAFLEDALNGGPIFYDGGGRQFYALTPRGTARRWGATGIERLGPSAFLGIPATDITEPDPRCTSYWCVPMRGSGFLCQPRAVARLAVTGRTRGTKREAEKDA
ncbi:MAG TPA: hypothetical protein VN520_17250 [Streptomyces sp.]|uniref:hypothetical protein n=1 Tax=Streptomyces sp. TaxID=1931 RepID=UPI002CB2F8FF|nr:hypothetical protein [Streptomyces sp.]HWU08103.1 hypothetical protein [Streptomyces sp.]